MEDEIEEIEEIVPSTIEQTVTCHGCGRKYRQIMKPQQQYGSRAGMDICPYCFNVNKKSYEFLYKNYRIKGVK